MSLNAPKVKKSRLLLSFYDASELNVTQNCTSSTTKKLITVVPTALSKEQMYMITFGMQNLDAWGEGQGWGDRNQELVAAVININ